MQMQQLGRPAGSSTLVRKTSALGGVRCLAPAVAGLGMLPSTRGAAVLVAAAQVLLIQKRLPPPADVHRTASRPGSDAEASALEQNEAVAFVLRLAQKPGLPSAVCAYHAAVLAFQQEMWQAAFEVYSCLAHEYITLYHTLTLEFPPGLLLTPLSWSFWAPASGLYTDVDEALLAAVLVCHAEKVGAAARPLVDATLSLFRKPLTLQRWRRRRAAGSPVVLTPFERIIAKELTHRLRDCSRAHLYGGLRMPNDAVAAGPVDVARFLLKHLCRENA